MTHAVKNNLLVKGENHPQAKLTEYQVQLIREDLKNNVKIKDIAEDFGVGTTAISNIKLKKKWKHVI